MIWLEMIWLEMFWLVISSSVQAVQKLKTWGRNLPAAPTPIQIPI